MAIWLPSSRVSSYSKTGPTSPVLSFGADLSRFPPESLPSCTMGAQMGEPINSRQNVLRQSIELMRDRPGLTGSDPGIASGKGQSKREVEAQSVMELLSKATLIGQGSKDIRGLGLASGPLTEPATLDSGNVFEQSLLPRSQTPDQLDGAGDKSHTNGVEETEGASEVGPKDGVRGLQKKTINDFVILEDIGQGAYGQVKLARSKKSSMKKMVLKYVTKRRILVDTWTRDRRLGTVPLEIHVLDYLRHDGLKHPNIVEMSDFFEDDINYYIEMVPHGLPGMDLFDYIELRVSMQEEECRSIFRQVARAVHHLHIKALVVHRDIKDENVILDSQGNIKLIDFGSATYIKNGPFDVFVGTIGQFSVLGSHFVLSKFADPKDTCVDYAAPEVLAGRSYRGKEQDVWALGILLYTIVYKENPFYSVDEIMDHDLRVPHVMSENCIDLIRQMLNREVGQRINISQVLEHPWCREEDEEENNYDNDNDGDGTL